MATLSLPFEDALEAAWAHARAVLQELVDTPSGSYDVAGVNATGDILAREWGRLGFTERRDPVDGFGDIRLMTRRLGGKGRVMILGHLDTVWPREDVGGWRYAETVDEATAPGGETVATGPGVGDMKGGLVMALLAVEALLADGFDDVGEIAVLLVPDEELGSPGSRARIEAEAKASDCVLVLEPARPDGGIVTSRGAVGAMIVRAAGRTAHIAVNPEEGRSALAPLAEIVGIVEAMTDLGRGRLATVGVLKAGSARQVVPDRAEMHIDLRAPDQDGAETMAETVRTAAAAAAAKRPGVEITVSGGVTRPAFPAAVSAPLVAPYLEIAAAAGVDVNRHATRGGSDGSFGAALGVPTLDGLGPICFDTCSRRERIILSSIKQRASFFAALIQRLSGDLARAPSQASSKAPSHAN
ncbi:M20/M25/M40 family metallo-hydrolase [Acuticoccus mangrovi]|uniref:M20/M25/M40 family metallo-hydrolase n=1 Tax=Acuticoccus mangrovi TaxID=2796142 RepID=A0A934INT7_9HYPH|nr:M20/M25/M40 family metallo-hydrolase [Acuticoccus mangrovi]MBJ3776000.1 M20/M25/M40 family metallo-hydrolase [Acuticoccus mangrovi]